MLGAGRWGATGVDVTMTAVLEFPSGILAQVSCSFLTPFHRHALITGDGGAMTTTFLNHPPIGGPAELRLKRGMPVDVPWEIVATSDGNGFLAEAESLSCPGAGRPAGLDRRHAPGIPRYRRNAGGDHGQRARRRMGGSGRRASVTPHEPPARRHPYWRCHEAGDRLWFGRSLVARRLQSCV